MGEQKYSPRDLELAVDDLATMRYFPHDQRGAIMAELARMVPHKRALDWLTQQCRTKIRDWPGLAELRGVLCTRFDATDGIDAYSTIVGFSPADGERRSIEEHQKRKTRELAQGALGGLRQREGS